MEFPITRERLQKYREKEAPSAEIKKCVLKEIQKICEGVENIVLTTKKTKYVYEITHIVKYGDIKHNTPHPELTWNTNGCLKELLAELKNKFPDSNIIMDPLEKYILIDWS